MKTLNSCNDLIIDKLGHLYFEGPRCHPFCEKESSRSSTRIEGIPDSYQEQLCQNAKRTKSWRLNIKNMVSVRCKMVVNAVLESMDISATLVELGTVDITENLSKAKRQQLKTTLKLFGLELIEDKKEVLVEEIVNIIVQMIHHSDEQLKTNFSDYLSKQLNHDYTYLSNLFSEIKGSTIEHFIISHEIEVAKEFLSYHELTLSEIAWKLHYCSVAHLSHQFKLVTGLTPTEYKNAEMQKRIPIENV